ncbi:hypothetical protein IAT38_005188 [Cryptococcus sp. DSM 104549]
MAAKRLQTKTVKNILAELRKVCQHPYLSAPDLEPLDVSEEERHRQLVSLSGKLHFLKLLLPKLKERGHRVLLFSQFKMSLDRVQDFLWGEGIKFLRLDGSTPAAKRQQYMDMYNAPNSEYDVFLLTTRAGGVGINLATADTVIIHDPDFNPHQDLQAIARAHRFGQKKRVLVFKLMVKGSVEENIMNSGKKKMVLDHVVVQQMGSKDTDESVLESDVFLQGIQSVYSTQSGINGPDITYNSKNVDELIDKVEADAEAEAKAMEERDEAIARGEVEPAKQGAQFGFAKIWEADQNALREAEEAAEAAAAQQEAEADWESIMGTIQKEKEEREERELAASRLARRNRLRMEAQYVEKEGDLDMEGGIQSPEKKKRRVSKGKKAAGAAQSSDAEYVGAGEGQSASDDETVSMSGSIPDIIDLPSALAPVAGPSGLASTHYGQNLADGLLANVKQKRGPKKKSTPSNSNPTVPAPSGSQLFQPIAYDPSASPPISNGGPSRAPKPKEPRGAKLFKPIIYNPSASPPVFGAWSNKARKPKETAEENARRKRAKLAHLDEAAAAAAANAILLAAGQAVAPEPIQQQTSILEQEPQSPPAAAVIPLDAEARVAGQNVLQWLYQIIREFKWDKYIEAWAVLGLEEFPSAHRITIYNRIAEAVDERLVEYGEEPYFTRVEASTAVHKLLQANESIIPQLPSIPSIPPEAGYKSSLGPAKKGRKSSSATPGGSVPSTPVVESTAAVNQGSGSSLQQSSGLAPVAGGDVAPAATPTPSDVSAPPTTSAPPTASAATAAFVPPSISPSTAPAVSPFPAITASASPSMPGAPAVVGAPAPSGLKPGTVVTRGNVTATFLGYRDAPPAPAQQGIAGNQLGSSPHALPANQLPHAPAAGPVPSSSSQPPSRARTPVSNGTPTQEPVPEATRPVSYVAPSCDKCRKPHHISQCTELTPLPELAGFMRSVKNGNTRPETREADLASLEKMRQFHVKAGNLAPDEIFPPPTPPPQAAAPLPGAASASMGKFTREVIVIDDDDDEEEVRPQPRRSGPTWKTDNGPSEPKSTPESRLSKAAIARALMSTPTFGGSPKSSSGENKTAGGPPTVTCVLCHGPGPHDTDHCPAMQTTADIRQAYHTIVASGQRINSSMYSALSGSYAKAVEKEFPNNPEAAPPLTQFDPREARPFRPIPEGSVKPPAPPRPPVVKPPPICPFCEKPCGRTVKQCVLATGDRKALKDTIRMLEEQLRAGTGNAKQLKDRQIPLFNVYRNWPRTEGDR